MSEQPLLKIEQLSAGYDGAPVIRDISFAVSAGEVVALLGANGAGKSTTLRAISGLVEPMVGRITFDGTDVGSMPVPTRARLGIVQVPEGRGIFYGLTVEEHFRLSAHGEQLDTARAYECFPALSDLRTRKAGLLSGGEQQMLAVGRAIARTPKVLLLDELSLGLAPVIVERILPVVKDYARAHGCAVVLVEQHVQLALGIAEFGYVLSHGEISVSGSAETLAADRELLLSSYLGDSEQR